MDTDVKSAERIQELFNAEAIKVGDEIQGIFEEALQEVKANGFFRPDFFVDFLGRFELHLDDLPRKDGGSCSARH